MPKIIRNEPTGKPAKPYKDYPLFAHATRRWAKKIRGKHHYFGPWNDPEGALKLYLAQKDDIYAGRSPSFEVNATTVRLLINHFLTAKTERLESGEISQRTVDDYHRTCKRLISAFGKETAVSSLTPENFAAYRKKVARRWGPVALGNEIQRVRTIFGHGIGAELLARPVRFGQQFKKPSRKTVRLDRSKKPKKLFEAATLRTLIDAAGSQLKAMILLAINCGLGNSDCGNLSKKHINLKRKWLDYPRPKTGVERDCPLWPETVKALREAILNRPKAKSPNDSRLVFITKYGQPWVKDEADSPIAKEFTKLLKSEKLRKPGLSFYAIRHTFATIAGGSKDQVVVDYIMGHVKDDMPSNYRQQIDNDRLLAVTQHVHAWLFGESAK